MTFLHPALLWSFLALLPLAALYFLKVRPRRKPTTALFLWDGILAERRSSSLFRRLRDSGSLLLMLLVCSAICLALAQPEWNDRRQDLLILIDNSASMAAKEGGTARIDSAKRAAAEIVEGLNGSQRAAVATVAQRVSYRSHLTDNPRELLDAVESVTASNQSLRLDVLAVGEDSNNHYLRDGRVILISDGCFAVERLPEHIELIKIGSALDNLGIVAADMAYLPDGTDRLAVYCQVASSWEEPREVDLVVARIDDNGNEQMAKVIPLKAKPGVNPAQTFTLEKARPGKWIARLNAGDAFPQDDTAYLVAARPDPIRIGVTSADRFFLEKSVLAFSQNAGFLTLVKDMPDVALANAAVPDNDKMILFHPTGESRWWKDLGERVEASTPRITTKNHPALRHVDVTAIPFVGVQRLTPPPGAQILASDDDGTPLIYTARLDNRSAIVVNMDPVAGEFYFSAWFPVLVHSAATFLAGRENSLRATYRPGDVVPIPGASDDTVSKWTTESNEEKEIHGKLLTLDDQLGYSGLSNASGKWFVGSSLLAETETSLGDTTAANTCKALSRGRSATHWLTLMAIVVLTVESVLYHRRKVG